MNSKICFLIGSNRNLIRREMALANKLVFEFSSDSDFLLVKIGYLSFTRPGRYQNMSVAPENIEVSPPKQRCGPGRGSRLILIAKGLVFCTVVGLVISNTVLVNSKLKSDIDIVNEKIKEMNDDFRSLNEELEVLKKKLRQGVERLESYSQSVTEDFDTVKRWQDETSLSIMALENNQNITVANVEELFEKSENITIDLEDFAAEVETWNNETEFLMSAMQSELESVEDNVLELFGLTDDLNRNFTDFEQTVDEWQNETINTIDELTVDLFQTKQVSFVALGRKLTLFIIIFVNNFGSITRT